MADFQICIGVPLNLRVEITTLKSNKQRPIYKLTTSNIQTHILQP